MKAAIIDWIKSYYYSGGDVQKFNAEAYADQLIWWTLALLGGLIIASFVIWIVSRFILIKVLHVVANKTKSTWDDHLVNNKVFRAVALLVPLGFLDYSLSLVLFNYPNFSILASKLAAVLSVLIYIIIVNRFFNGLRDIVLEIDRFKDKPVQSFSQIFKILITGILLIVMLSIITNKSPVFFLTSLGAVSAMLLLIFKDTILGFVGSIQLSANDMIRVGDWVTMSKYGADGDVTEINLTTVKIQNFDNTITTIPTYSFISDFFVNWRGMTESDGRRIKRSVKIQIDTVKFASPELLKKLKDIKLIESFVEEREVEITTFNKSQGINSEDVVNGRSQTNLGLFRRYLDSYLRNNPNLNKEMTLMVRQLGSDEYGVPLEVYCFSATKEWADYEAIIADVFDHIYAVVETFELRVFENPTGNDFKKLKN
ncbi:MAG: mechanosensitive ion channel [Crocinitomicaceae bacterium]|nr:mechanosensitive ion channel [Crocinitomicaceae bacterium]MDG1776965.1 mechanosensitive ion channel [Crocinitomicaceae bacterium]